MTPIKVAYQPKPVPFRGWDWEAWREEDEHSPRGTGSTQLEAITDLLDREEEQSEAEEAQARRDDERHYIEHGPGCR